MHRFKKGSGLPVRIPVIDMTEIGAGSGSIARLNALGLLTVGPDSAASQLGPACYGRGGAMPTAKDADVVLSYLNRDYFLGRAMKLDVKAARRAIFEHLAGSAIIEEMESTTVVDLNSSFVVDGHRDILVTLF